MKPDSPFRKAINAIEVWVSVFAMLLLILVVSIQVFCRYVLQDSLAWTEELAVTSSSGACFSDAVSPCAPTPTSSFPSFPTFPAPA